MAPHLGRIVSNKRSTTSNAPTRGGETGEGTHHMHNADQWCGPDPREDGSEGCGLKGILVRDGKYQRNRQGSRVRFAQPLVDARWNPPRLSEDSEASSASMSEEEQERAADAGAYIIEASEVKLNVPHSSRRISYESDPTRANHFPQKDRGGRGGAVSNCIVDLTSPRQASGILYNNLSATYNPVYGDVLLGEWAWIVWTCTHPFECTLTAPSRCPSP